MFWLDEGLPTSLAPGRRPRTTLSPSMARLGDGTRMAFGTPGGDQQDQWQLVFLLRLLHHGHNLQEAIDAPLFHTGHLQASFFPRGTRPGHLAIEPAAGDETIARLRARGHLVEVTEPWAAGRLCAASRRPDGLMKAAATPRQGRSRAWGEASVPPSGARLRRVDGCARRRGGRVDVSRRRSTRPHRHLWASTPQPTDRPY